ncbi:MAG: SDR family oxidoreductase, partial [Klebsiella sp.]|nr:SDR family oxidoreductase [Klebsiella sp.]
GGGNIINIASVLGFSVVKFIAPYAISKAGVVQATKALALELAASDIRVNALAPGYMATNNTQQLRADEQRSSEILDRIPAGRWGLPSDLMGPVVFLASSASDYINGYTVAVDGGWLAR